jgi:hypothetical protein
MARARRMSITVPAELKARMDQVDADFNWSSVAARAFEREIARRNPVLPQMETFVIQVNGATPLITNNWESRDDR